MRERKTADISAGLALVALGVVGAAESFGYGIGNARSMGAGFVPFFIGGIVVVMGVVIAVGGYVKSAEGPAVKIVWRPLISICAAIAAFALLLRLVGFFPASVVAILICCNADRNIRPVSSIIFAVALATAGWLIFNVGLGLNLPPLDGVFSWNR